MPVNDEEHSLPEQNKTENRMIDELALDLHLKRSEELIADLPSDSPEPSQKETNDYIIDGKTVRFPSIEARNRCVARYLFEKNRQAFANNPQMWLSTARDLWRHEIGKNDTAGGRLLALVNNIDDLFVIAANAIESGSLQVFDVLHVIVNALPYVNNVPVDGIFRLCIAQHEKTKNDLAAGMLFNKLEKVLEGQVANCRAIHERLVSHTIEATSSLHTCVLLALAKTSYEDAVTLALQDTQSSNELLKTAALWTLGRLISLPMVTDEVIVRVSTVIISNMSNPIELVRRTAVHAAAHATPSTQAFEEQLSKLGEAGDQDALAAIANILLLNRAEMKSKPIFQVWVRLLRKLSPTSVGALNYYDSVLSELLIDENQQQFVISCLTDWATANAKDIPRDKAVAELFDATIFKLANRQELLSEMITDWFISENRQLAAAAAGILSHLDLHGLKNAEFSTRRLDELEQNDLLFLARRMLGFVYSENHLISLTMSFLKTKDALHRAFPIVNSLLVDELGQDHPSLTIESLETAKSSTTDKEWIAFYLAVIEKINSRMKALEALPRLSELRPLLSLQRQFERARTKQMSNAAEEAQKKSIIQQIATKIPLKAGKGWFSFRDGSYTEPSYLKSFSHAVSIPRRITLDLVGYEISRFMFRHAKRDQP
jgi:hypothetical protein